MTFMLELQGCLLKMLVNISSEVISRNANHISNSPKECWFIKRISKRTIKLPLKSNRITRAVKRIKPSSNANENLTTKVCPISSIGQSLSDRYLGAIRFTVLGAIWADNNELFVLSKCPIFRPGSTSSRHIGSPVECL